MGRSPPPPPLSPPERSFLPSRRPWRRLPPTTREKTSSSSGMLDAPLRATASAMVSGSYQPMESGFSLKSSSSKHAGNVTASSLKRPEDNLGSGLTRLATLLAGGSVRLRPGCPKPNRSPLP
eukprot:scaffold1197_cov121-Isochrysis_galbana.AAC.9